MRWALLISLVALSLSACGGGGDGDDFACTAEAGDDRCACYPGATPANLDSCSETSFGGSVCCSDGDLCSCNKFGCKEESFGCACSLYGEPSEKVLGSCQQTAPYPCCQGEFLCVCLNYDGTCDADEIQVTSCTAAGWTCNSNEPDRVSSCG